MTLNDPYLLLVEADLAIRHPLAEYLRTCGYKVIEAGTTDEALTMLQPVDHDFEIEMLLCDVNGPGSLNGFGLSRWVREHKPGVQVILAGSVEKMTEEAGNLCENGPILEKPYHHQTLLDRIKREMARRDLARSKP